jgi:hypothetical protein
VRFAYGLPPESAVPNLEPPAEVPNPLEQYFDSITEGPGVWKWRHYFPIYHRHLAKFIGHEVHVAEIGIYSGGSLPMWRGYFGHACRVYGIDIAPECKVHEQDGIEVFIGDQSDPAFWEDFRQRAPRLDVVIDDGGHEAHQQITTLRCLLPHMAMGGVYICEDVHHPFQQFHSFVDGISRTLSDVSGREAIPPLALHQHVSSVHRYPLMTVIEKPNEAVESFDSVKHGSTWEPRIRL